MKGARRICGVVGGDCGGRPDTPPPPPRLTSPHGGSVAPQERRRSSNFKYVLTRNQKVAYHNGGKNPHFPCDHLLDPKVNGGGAAETGGDGRVGWGGTDTPGYSLCTFFDIPHPQIWEQFSHFETSFFTGEIEALISPHLSSMKSHKWSMRIPAPVRRVFICLTFFSPLPPSDRPGFAVVQSPITGVQRIWRLYRRIPDKRMSWKLRWIRLRGCFERFSLGWLFYPPNLAGRERISWRRQSIGISAIWTFLSCHKALLCWIKHFPFN